MQESSFSLSGVQMTRNYVSAIIEGSGIYSYDTYICLAAEAAVRMVAV